MDMAWSTRRKVSEKRYNAYAFGSPDDNGGGQVVGIVRMSGRSDYNRIEGICIPFVSGDGASMDLQMGDASFFGNRESFTRNRNNEDEALRAFNGFERLFIRDLEERAKRCRNRQVQSTIRQKVLSVEKYGKPIEVPLESIGITGGRRDLLDKMVGFLENGVGERLLADMEPVDGQNVILLPIPPSFRYLAMRHGGHGIYRSQLNTKSDRLKFYEANRPKMMYTPIGGAPDHAKPTRHQ